MSSTGPAVLAGPPSVIAQASLESEAFRIAASTPPHWQAVQTPREPQRVTGRPRQLHLHFNGVGAEDVAAILARDHLPGGPILRAIAGLRLGNSVLCRFGPPHDRRA